MINPPRIILASGSPRRSHLLQQLGLSFDIIVPHVDESNVSSTAPRSHVIELSKRKADAVSASHNSSVVIGADTIVVNKGLIMGKPETREGAVKMLKQLGGTTHYVYTGYTINGSKRNSISGAEKTAVTFRELELWEIESYVDTWPPYDKAGSYGIQDFSGVFVKRLEGCFYNVVGLPLHTLYLSLKEVLGGETLSQLIMKSG